MYSDLFALRPALLAFETILHIEYSETDTAKIILSAKQRLENSYQVKLDDTVYNIQKKNAFTGDSLDMFLQNLAEPVKLLAGVNAVTMYLKKSPVSLGDVNYLGFAAETLRTALKYLQDEKSEHHKQQIILALTSSCNNIEMCEIKRILIVLLVLDSLGIREAVAITAQTLYLGGLNL
jgi:hypothetical protein